jgi:hypothetical protein
MRNKKLARKVRSCMDVCMCLLSVICYLSFVGLARTIYMRCLYGVFGREINKYTVIYGVYPRFWPTLFFCGEGRHWK